MNAEQHEWYWRGYNDAKESIQSDQLRVWFGLTDEEKDSFWTADQMTHEEWQQLFAEVEAKLKEKNT